jgi:hypothetical protein
MYSSLKPSQRMAVIGAVNPQSATTVQVTGWLSAKNFLNFLAIINVGALGASATVDAKVQQATDGSGTGAKDITGKAITQLTKASTNDNSQVMINLKQEDFDIANNFNYFQVSVTPAVAACLVGVIVLGVDPCYAPGAAAASVLQTVN